MGAASSFITLSDKSARSNHSSTGVISDKTGSDRSQGSNPNVGSTRYSAHSVTLPSSIISNSLLDTCILSWEVIEPPSKKLDRESKVITFCQKFFQILDTLDLDKEVRTKFRPRRQSAILTRSGLLIRIVKYMLSVPNDSFKVKAKIRALGRSHSTRGIVEKHFLVFSDVLILCLTDALNLTSNDAVIVAWKLLLQFFVDQLTFDKVIFVSHRTTVEDEIETATGTQQHGHHGQQHQQHQDVINYEEAASALLRASSLGDSGNNPTSMEAYARLNGNVMSTESINDGNGGDMNHISTLNNNHHHHLILSEEDSNNNSNSISLRHISKRVPMISLPPSTQSHSTSQNTHAHGTNSMNSPMNGTFVSLDKASLDRNGEGIAMMSGYRNPNNNTIPISESSDIASTTTESIASSRDHRDRDFPSPFGTVGTAGNNTYNGNKQPSRNGVNYLHVPHTAGGGGGINNTTTSSSMMSSKSSSNSDMDVNIIGLEADLVAMSLAAVSDFAETLHSSHDEDLNLELNPGLNPGLNAGFNPGLVTLGSTLTNTNINLSSNLARTSSVGSPRSRRMEVVQEAESERSSSDGGDGSNKSKSHKSQKSQKSQKSKVMAEGDNVLLLYQNNDTIERGAGNDFVPPRA